MTWIRTGESRFRLDRSPEEAAAYVEGILDGETAVIEGRDGGSAVEEPDHADDESAAGSDDERPEYAFRTTPPGDRFATRYAWTVVADPEGDGTVVEQRRETTLGTVLLLLLPAVLSVAFGAALFAGAASVDGVPRWAAAVATSLPWTPTVGLVAGTLGVVAAAGVYQWRLRRPALLVPLGAVALIPIFGAFAYDAAVAVLLAADGLPAQPWIVAVPALAAGAVPFALVRSFYRPSPGGVLAERDLASVEGRGDSLPLGIGLGVTVAVAPALLLLPAAARASFAGPLPRAAGGWMAAVGALLVVAVTAESLRGGSTVRRLGGGVPTLSRRLWIERFETTDSRQRATLPQQPLHLAVGNVRSAAGERGIGTAVAPSPRDDGTVIAGRRRLMGTAYEYAYRVRQGEGLGDPPTLAAERRVPNGTRGLVAYFALVPVALFGAVLVGDAVGPLAVVPAVAVVLPAPAVALLAPVVQILVPRPFDPSVFPDGYQGFPSVGRVALLVGALAAVTVGALGWSTAFGPPVAVGVGVATVALSLRRGDYTRTELERLWTTLPVPLVSYPVYALGLGAICLLALRLMRELARVGYGRVGVPFVVGICVLYGVVRLQENRDDAAHEHVAYRTWNEDYVERDRLRWAIVLGCPLLVGGSGAALGALALAVLDAADTASTVVAVAVLAGLSVPTWYYVGGFAFQTVGGTVGRLLLLRRSRSVPAAELPALPDEVNATVMAYETGPEGQFGLSTGRRAVICLHQETLDVLGDDPEAFAALLAHEDAHASVYDDGLLSTYVPFAATALLAGQNLVYAALDFRAREFRADRHAAAVVSPEATARAIERVDEARERGAESAASAPALFASLTPFVPAMPGGGAGAGPFSISFGGFAMSNAHPSVAERVDRLRSTSADGGGEAGTRSPPRRSEGRPSE